MEKNIEINGKKYILEENYREAFDLDAIKEKLTDYFDDYDYIIGDWAYGKLRLKGFCNKNNKMFNRTNNIENVESYLQNNCAYGCRWFKLKNNH